MNKIEITDKYKELLNSYTENLLWYEYHKGDYFIDKPTQEKMKTKVDQAENDLFEFFDKCLGTTTWIN